MNERVPEIVLTGGPCSGKTTGLAYTLEKLMDRGHRVFLVPEVPTMFILGGVQDISRLAIEEPEKYFEVEKQMLLTHLKLRHSFGQLADIFRDEKRVIIFDRGGMDFSAYMPKDFWKAILEDAGLKLHHVRDSYDAVIHLVTTAIGAEQFYNTENNKARRETKEEARLADKKTLDAWTGHSHLKIIDNSTDFEGKMRRLLSATCRILGIPVPIEIERKFLLASNPDFESPELRNAQKILIEQMYLVSDGKEETESRIRRRSQNGSATYYRTWKKKVSPSVRNETEVFITAEDYFRLSTLKDPKTHVIRKFRYCFVYNYQYFELDVIAEREHTRGVCLLEIELTEENDRLELPPFLNIVREVTGDERYSNYFIARNL